MGWISSSMTRDETIEDCTREKHSGGKTWRSVARCYRGGKNAGTLWHVRVVTDDATGHEDARFIECDLLRSNRGEWAVKEMEESSHPFYYSCPLSYLDKVPEECAKWRESVRAYHAKRNKKLTVGSNYGVVPGLKLSNGTPIKSIRVVSVRPIRGYATLASGTETTIPVAFKKAYLTEALTVADQ